VKREQSQPTSLESAQASGQNRWMGETQKLEVRPGGAMSVYLLRKENFPRGTIAVLGAI
jgi:hypothetical protein